jgi:para-nitrobenzyl esterase
MGVKRRIPWVLLTVLIVTAAVLPVTGCGATIGSLSEVRLDSGPITGAVEAGVWSFKGIPYAAPPVGDLRWQPPQPVSPWTDTRACTSFGPACPQPTGGDLFYLSVGPTSEDCLYLNVWSPAKSSSDRLPVMVWIHGGSFVTGAGSMPVYDGQNLAKRDVVVVTINYRLGPLGFLALPALSRESTQGSSGNYGLLDQLAALQWVQRNIAAFGGDPKRVTVFGESAGAISILDLLVSPQSTGLFQAAIAESGILLDAGFGGVSTAATREDAEKAGEVYAAKLGVDPTGDVAAQLRAMSADQLVAAAGGGETLMDTGLAWKPCVDGLVLADLPSRLWAEGKQMTVPLLIGSNKDEGNAFLAGLSIPPELYDTYMRKLFGQYADEALALYPAKQASEVLPALSRMLTEVGFASTARFAARTESQAPLPHGSASLYEFTRVPLGNPLGAFHAVEIPYVFGNIGLFASLGTLEQTDYDLSDAIMGYWTRFAATGNPNGDGATVWPEYDPATDEHLELGDTIKTGSGLYKEACDLADKVRGIE